MNITYPLQPTHINQQEEEIVFRSHHQEAEAKQVHTERKTSRLEALWERAELTLHALATSQMMPG